VTGEREVPIGVDSFGVLGARERQESPAERVLDLA